VLVSLLDQAGTAEVELRWTWDAGARSGRSDLSVVHLKLRPVALRAESG
jgi:hypothetical protein